MAAITFGLRGFKPSPSGGLTVQWTVKGERSETDEILTVRSCKVRKKTSSVMASREIGRAAFPVRGEGFGRAADCRPYG